MNVSKISQKLCLWQPVTNFPSFKELVNLSKNYYANQLRIVFVNIDDQIFYGCDLDFTDNNTEVSFTIYKMFTNIRKRLTIDPAYNDWNEYQGHCHTLSKYSFSKKFADEVFNHNGMFTHYCLLSDFYLYVKDSLNN